jgi:hypothetical protein
MRNSLVGDVSGGGTLPPVELGPCHDSVRGLESIAVSVELGDEDRVGGREVVELSPAGFSAEVAPLTGRLLRQRRAVRPVR